MSKTIVIRKKVNKPKQEMTVKESKELVRTQIKEKGWERTYREALPFSEESPYIDILCELDQVNREEKNKELETIIRKAIREDIKKRGAVAVFTEIYGCPPGSSHYAYFEAYDRIHKKKESKLSAQETFALFITLSPEPGTATPEDILGTFSNMLGKPKKGIYKAYWSIQQSGGEKPEGYHLHCLIVLDKQAGPSAERNKIKSMLTRHLSKYKTKSEAYLDIKPVSKENVKDKLDYVLGTNYNKEKMKTAEI